MEHWLDPAGTRMEMDRLRNISAEREVPVTYGPEEEIIIGGEQVKKQRTLKARNIRTWQELTENAENVCFASFIPPGTYDVETPWKNEWWRIANFEKAVFREIESRAADRP